MFESKNEELSGAKVDLNTVQEVQSVKSKSKSQIDIQDAKAESVRLSDKIPSKVPSKVPSMESIKSIKSLKADITAPKMDDEAQADQPESPAQAISQVSAVQEAIEELNNKSEEMAPVMEQ